MKPKITGRYAPQCMGKLTSKIFSWKSHASDDKSMKDFPGFLVFILASFSMLSASVLPSFAIFKLLYTPNHITRIPHASRDHRARLINTAQTPPNSGQCLTGLTVFCFCQIMNGLIRLVIYDYCDELGNGENVVTLSSEIPGTWD